MTSKLTRRDTNKVYIRNLFSYQWGQDYEKVQGLGYAWVMMPALKRLYSEDPVTVKKALKTHLDFMDTMSAMSHLIIGADIALEEEVGIEDETATTGLKTNLVGPFASVGDTIFVAIHRAIVFSIAAYTTQGGWVVGLLIPLTVGAMALWVRYKFTWIDYHQGKKVTTEFADKMKLFTQGAAVLGLTVIGGLIPSVIAYKLDLTCKVGGITLSVQEMLDRILPALIPLEIVLLSYWLLGRKKMNSAQLIFILILIGMILSNLQPMLT